MKGFKTAIENAAIENTNFREVLYTSKFSQLVLMRLAPLEEIGLETHRANDQFFRVEKGHAKCLIDGNEYELRDGDAVVVPSGAQHNIINLSETDALKLYTIYSPPHHLDKTLRATKAEAEKPPEEYDGQPTEEFPADEVDSSLSFKERIEDLEIKVFDKIKSVKSKEVKKLLVKNAERIVKYEGKIDKLKGKMTKLHETIGK